MNNHSSSDICSCNSKKEYSEQYDCYYCQPCNKWTEDKCDDVECEFCSIRPNTPLADDILSR